MIITRSKAKPKGKRDGRSDDEGESYGMGVRENDVQGRIKSATGKKK
jgi:hypothetical protein